MDRNWIEDKLWKGFRQGIGKVVNGGCCDGMNGSVMRIWVMDNFSMHLSVN